MAFPTHGIRYGSSYRLEPKRRVLQMQNGKVRAIAYRPDMYRIFDVRTVPLTLTQTEEWDTHFNSIADDGSDSFSFDGTSYTCRYLARPERIQVAKGLFELMVRLREVG